MSQAVRDLPDPLDPSPSLSTSDPDDLLSKMADEAIDRLIADADNGKVPSGRALPIEPQAEAAPSMASLSSDAGDMVGDVEDPDEDDEPAYPATADAANSLVADGRVITIDESTPKPAEVDVVIESVEAAEAEEVADADVDAHDEPVADAADVSEEVTIYAAADGSPVAADRQALLAEQAAAPSIALLSLRVLNWPFGWIGDGARRLFGLVGIVTLVPAIAAIVYVLWLKQHWGR